VRTVEIPAQNLTFDDFKWYILSHFAVSDITIMHGDQFITNQTDLDTLLSPGQSIINLTLYDAYNYDQYDQSQTYTS